MHLRQAFGEENIERLKMQSKLAEIRHKLSELDCKQTYGSKELTEIIQEIVHEINSISPFLELSKNGLTNLIDLAFKVSLKKEESRYPRFQIYIPVSRYKIEDFHFLVRFDPPIALNVSTLHRISSGIPPRPYALYLRESDSEKTIDAYGFIRIETFDTKLTSTSKALSLRIYPGLILSIEEPGVLNVLLFNDIPLIIPPTLALRHGKIEINYNTTTTPIVKHIYADIERNIVGKNKQGNLSSEISKHIASIWSYILSLAVDFRQGGQFIILPSDFLLDGIQDFKPLDVNYRATEPDLGVQIADLVTAEQIQNKYQSLLDSARAIAKLSTADGCIVFDRGLRLLGFKGEVLVRENPECVELNLASETLEEIGSFDINQFGTRHRSAARFCGKVPGGVAFVVSQDGDIRLFMHIDDRKVGVGGPFRPVPGLSPYST
jgi:hypothetical protein